ncbi:Peroxisomal membrane protein PMP27 [Paramarasmius palmivorus]|uniref:Peroxisomal membrane protein PMP27 n=1 Tax=Paramarasmius palmivorus TaxID=297713 RepID=A0AAW0E4E7_9AGAR
MASIASQIILHPTVNQSLKYSATTLGRDKAYRAIQYFARFYTWYLLSRGEKDVAARWNALKTHLATARKLMRLGKPMEHLQAALKACLSQSTPVEQITTIGRQLGYFGYLSLDAVVWAHTIKFLNLSPETATKVAKFSNRFWLAGILFSIVNGAVKSVRLASEAKKLQSGSQAELSEKAGRETRLSAIAAARNATRQQLTIDMLDLWIPATNIGLTNLNDGVLGIFGLITSLIAAQAQWEAVNGK